MYRMIKTHKESNHARIITSGSGTAVKSPSIFVVFEFLDITLSFDATSKQILVDIFSKPTNSFI